ncbi:MAG: tetratricopeptide repeat protein [Deltaproteobacteria bacterium]|nr:tetratricopeptide repeat protein [Deltaproteobacteria bacterium]
MSYIHEALKKAQVERDLGKGFQGGLPVPLRKRAFFTKRKTIFSAALLLLLLLAFAGYSWWYLKNKNPNGVPLRKNTVPDRQQVVSKREPRAGLEKMRPANPPRDHQTSLVPKGPSGTAVPAPLAGQKPVGSNIIAETYQKARALHRDGRLPDAAEWYEKVISIDPGHVEALNNRGVLYLQEKDYASARRYFEKAIRLKPDYVDPYYNLACVSAAAGQLQQSLRYLQKAISMDPGVKAWAQEDPDLNPLRGLSRFQEIVKK